MATYFPAKGEKVQCKQSGCLRSFNIVADHLFCYTHSKCLFKLEDSPCIQFHPEDYETCAPQFAMMRNPNEQGRWIVARELLNWVRQAEAFFKKKCKYDFHINTEDKALLTDLGDHPTLDDRIATAVIPCLQRKQHMLLARNHK